MNIFSFFHRRKRTTAQEQRDILRQHFKDQLTLTAGHILTDAETGLVRFVLDGDKSQVHCTFQWFASVTDGGDAKRVLTLRHCLLTAMNILNVRTGQPFFSEDIPMPLFVTLDGQPVMQYTFWGKSHVRCERYDQDVAEAIAAWEEVQKDEDHKRIKSGKESGL